MNFNINRVAVLGSGVMGAGIAAHIAGAGIPVCLLDMVPKALNEKETLKGLSMNSKLVRNRIAQGSKDRVINPRSRAIYHKDMGDLITVGNFTDDLDMLKDCDWIIEVIVENLEIKKSFMKNLSAYIKPNAIISSNTSGISINEIIEDFPIELRQRFMGTHFFNPPRHMKLLELIPGKDTSAELIEFMDTFGTQKLGKGVVMAKDTPNFVSNRIGVFALVNVVQLAEQYGYSIGKVDQLTGSIMQRPKTGTYRLMDMVGLDTMNHVVNNFVEKVVTEKEQFQLPEVCTKLINLGHLGDKTKQGFYKKVVTEKGKQTLVWDNSSDEYVPLVKERIKALDQVKKESNKLKALVFGEAEENKFAWDVIKNILLYSARNIPDIADDYKNIDNGMMWGYNWTMGPFAIWDLIGFEESVNRMKADGEVIPEWIEKRITNSETKFYDESSLNTPFITLEQPQKIIVKENEDAALVDIGDGVLCLQFKSKSNAITGKVVEMMNEAVEEVEKNYIGLVIGNQSKNFSVGANLMEIYELADHKKWEELSDFVEAFQHANMKLKYCKKPVVAAPYGMTLGGGAEVTMHSHKVTAHAETYMGLVEVGVGLIPAGGGTKELFMRSIENLGRVNNGEMISHVKRAWKTIIMGGKMSSSAHDAIQNGYIRKTDRVVMSRDYLIDQAKLEVLAMNQAGFRPLQKKLIPVLGANGKALLKYETVSMVEGGFISEYDAHIANKVAWVVSGGDVPTGVKVPEEQLLELEKQAFLSLCKEEKTLQRIEHMLKTGKPLRN